MARIMKIMTIVAAVVFVGVFVLIIGNVAGFFKSPPSIEQGDDKNKVPKLVGMTLKQAEDACQEAGLELSVIREEESEEYEKGYVFKQMTAEGVQLPEGTKVQVFISTGLKPIEIPDVSNKTESEAITELLNTGFEKKNIKIKTENHDTIEEDKITRTEPVAGESGNKNSKITLYVSKGVGQTTMPKLVGKSKADAEKTLTDAGLKGEIEEVNSEEPAGTVIAQGIEEGTVLDRMTTVKYMVSAGKAKVTIPNKSEYVGADVSTVVKDLEKYFEGYDITIDTTESISSVEKGKVAYVKDAGQSVEEGSTVIIVISKGLGTNGEAENGAENNGGAGNVGTRQ